MKKTLKVLCAVASVLLVAACGGAPATGGGDSTVQQGGGNATTIKQSPDKYTWYIKDYTGMNAASVGYEALDGFRHDRYGHGNLKVIFVANDGTYVDPGNEEQLKEYVVTGQNLDPNTELKYGYEVNSEGEEYDNLVNFQSYDEVVLSVSKAGSSESAPDFTKIQPAPDKYTCYVRDYVGRNLAECGYYSLGGNLTDAYGHGYIVFDIVADDGSYIDPEDTALLASYMVTSQSVEPNTEIVLTYMVDGDGNEYSNLIDTQSLERITLNVTKAPDSGYPVGDDAEADEAADSGKEKDAEAPEAPAAPEAAAGEGDIRAFLDSYEAFMNEYVDFMIKYADSDNPVEMLADYTDIMARYADMVAEFDAINTEDLSADDYAYYIEVVGRVTARLAEIA